MTWLFPRYYMKETCFSAYMAGMIFFGGSHAMAMAQTSQNAPDMELIELQVGETRVINHAGVTRVAVPDSK